MHKQRHQEAARLSERTPLLKSLRARVFAILIAALLPVVLLNLFTTYSRFIEAKHKARADLQDLSEIVTDEMDHYLNNAFALLTILSQQPEVLSQTHSCHSFLAAALKGFYGYSNLFIIDPGGHVTCSAVTAKHKISFTGEKWWQRLNTHGGPIVGEPATEPATGEQAVFIALPLTLDPVTGARGAIALALKDTTLQHLRRLVRVRPATLLFVLNDSGNIILGPSDKDSLAKLPEHSHDLAKAAKFGEAFDAKARSGAAYVYAVVPMLEGKVFAIVAQAAMTLDGPRILALSGQALLPILLTAGILVIVWIGTDRIVLRWIRHLTAVAVAYRRGHMAIRPKNLKQAPTELEQLGATLGDMASAIDVREQRLKETIRQCEILIREVHHRVKNNLQVIGSLLNLQARMEESPDAKRALRTIQLRVEAIGLVHRNIYLADEIEYVNLEDIVPNLARQVAQFFDDGSGRIELSTEIEPIWLTADRAVLLSQFVVEAAANSFAHAFPDGRAGQIAITLHREFSGAASLTVADNGVGSPTAGAAGRLGQSLMQSLARQLAGSLEVSSDAGTQVVLRFSYHAADFASVRDQGLWPEPAATLTDAASWRSFSLTH